MTLTGEITQFLLAELFGNLQEWATPICLYYSVLWLLKPSAVTLPGVSIGPLL